MNQTQAFALLTGMFVAWTAVTWLALSRPQTSLPWDWQVDRSRLQIGCILFPLCALLFLVTLLGTWGQENPRFAPDQPFRLRHSSSCSCSRLAY